MGGHSSHRRRRPTSPTPQPGHVERGQGEQHAHRGGIREHPPLALSPLLVAVVCILAGLLVACVAVWTGLVPAPATAAVPAPGDVASFWVIDWGRDQGVSGHPVQTVDGVVTYVGDHVVVYVQQGRTIPDAVAAGLGEAFDLNVYPSLTAALGSAPDPGVDGEPRLALLVYDFGDAAVRGYFNRNDIDVAVPLGVGAPGGSGTPAFSNHRELVSINLAALLGESERAADSAAHEFAHLLTQYHGYVLGTPGSRVAQTAWVDEGIATYGEALAGYAPKTALPLASFGADAQQERDHLGWQLERLRRQLRPGRLPRPAGAARVPAGARARVRPRARRGSPRSRMRSTTAARSSRSPTCSMTGWRPTSSPAGPRRPRPMRTRSCRSTCSPMWSPCRCRRSARRPCRTSGRRTSTSRRR